MKKTIFMFDLDGTLTKAETLPIIAEHFGIENSINELTQQTINGNIPFVESFIKRVNILKTFSVSRISSLLAEVTLNQKLLDFIKQNPDSCVVCTGNLDCWISLLCKRVGCIYYSSSADIVNDNVDKLVSILRKEDVVERYKSMGYQVVFVGDGNNDSTAMQRSDISIACGVLHQPARSVLAVCDYLVYDENALVRLLKQIKKPTSGKSVVITCAGIGSRLGLDKTKALIEVVGQPLIKRQLDALESVEDIRVVVGFQASEVINVALETRRDIIFVFNHDYFHTKTGASFYLGARHGYFYSVAWDGDLLVHPDDVKKCLEFDGEFVGCSQVYSDEPVYAAISADGFVTSFSRETGDREWVGPACIARDKLDFVIDNVFNQFEPHLPIPAVECDSRDIDTYEDYLRAIEFVRGWADG
ncbi:HAD-IB family phosphatase [Alphaproteobacteria bacterium]|nr:HAD-IB family phosphatase [Alphaproteobacteria bacterium]